MLTSCAEVSTRPTISVDSRVEGKHMVVFTDLSISGGRYNGTSLPLAQGLQACRTTRLHWLQTGLTQAENGTFVVEDGTPAVAPYGELASPFKDFCTVLSNMSDWCVLGQQAAPCPP